MFIAMNRFKVRKGSERDSRFGCREKPGGPGFVVFHLLKGPETQDHVLYASHTVWRSEKHFEAWTRSAFRKAHGGTRGRTSHFISDTQNSRALLCFRK